MNLTKPSRFPLLFATAVILLLFPARSHSQPTGESSHRGCSNLACVSRSVCRKGSRPYLKYGLEAEIIQMRPNVAMAALLSGDLDYVELIGSIIRSAAKGIPLRAVSTGIKAPFFSFVAQTRYKNMKDLKGAVIGLTSIGGTNYISGAQPCGSSASIRIKTVKLLAIGDEKLMYEALQDRPHRFYRDRSAVLRHRKTRRLPAAGVHGPIRNHSVFRPGHNDRANKTNRAQVKRLLKAEIEALRYIQANAAGTSEVNPQTLPYG